MIGIDYTAIRPSSSHESSISKLREQFKASPELQQLMIRTCGSNALARVLEPSVPSGKDLDQLVAELDDDIPEPIAEQAPVITAAEVLEVVPQPKPVDDEPTAMDETSIQFVQSVEPHAPAESAPVTVTPVPTIAPAFRQYPALPQRITGQQYTAEDDANLIQQYVDDFAWLYIRGHRVEIDTNACDGKARHLLTAETFDADLARVMAADKRLSGEAFTALLYLPPALEAEMRLLRTNASKRQRSNIRRDKPAIEARLHRSVTMSKRPEQVRHVPQWLLIWECVRLVGDSPSAIGRIYEAMTGNPMDKSRARALRDEVKRRLAGA